MLGLATDDRAVAVAAAGSRCDPESLIGCVAAATARYARPEEASEARRDRVVLVRSAGHRDDHAVEEFVPALAVLLCSEVVCVRRSTRQTQYGLHGIEAS